MSIASAVSRTLLAFLVLGIGGCSGANDGPTQPVVSQRGVINASVQATGGDLDDNGYTLVVGSARVRIPIGVNGAASFDFVAGTHTVTLEDVALNCVVVGPNPISVTVPAGGTVEAAFLVSCQATGIVVTTRTTGINIPAAGYQVLVTNPPPASVPANGSITISRLPPGRHMVSISIAADNCAATSARVVEVTIASGEHAEVAFDVLCGAWLERIAYTNYGDLSINVVKPDGTGKVALTPGHSPSWSPDGSRLVYTTRRCTYDYYSYDPDCAGGLRTVNPESRIVTSHVNGEGGFDPAWSPTSDVIAFVRCCDDVIGQERIYLMSIDSPGAPPATLLPLTSPLAASITAARQPAWSPDGQRLAFVCDIDHTDTDICVVNRDGTGLTRMTTDPRWKADPAWSPDGTRIAFTISDGVAPQVAVMSQAGGSVTIVTPGLNPAWSRDGTKLVFARANGLFISNADGSGVAQLVTGWVSDPAWRP